LLADNFGKVVDLIFANTNLQRAGSLDLWVGILAYGLQLYLDFSGYVDMARGSAILLGFNLPENFNFPYFTTNIAEFWRRWHITLGDWLRNYVYFPLGGSRKGLIRTCINLLIIMLIAGVWHGSSWGYVLWGALHGIALIIHRLNEALSQHFTFLKRLWSSFLGVFSAWLITQSMVFISWIFFRLPNFKDSMYVIEHLWGHNGDIQFAQKVYEEAIMLSPLQLTLIMVIVIILMSFAYILQRGLKLQLNWPIKLLLAPICLYAVWLLSPEDGLPYIYFDF
ncbi:MAG TPA: MBOAT family O-acyltransferase, partial [Allocoleopsis sp.]